MATGQLA
jgi:type I restriction enzyme, R subunit